jgi:formyltetrahydrofolate deformylase
VTAPARSGLGREIVLTLNGPDRRGIVHAVTGAMVGLDLNIIDSQQFGDRSTGEFHLRMHLGGEEVLDPQALDAARRDLSDALGADVDIHDPHEPHRLLIMVSKQGHVLNDLLFRVRTGQLNVVVPAVVSNHEDFRDEVEWHGIPFHHVPVTPETKPQAEARLREIIAAEQVETVALARYMQVLSEEMCADFPGRIINIHHSLLPSFKGARPYQQAHDRGVKVIGATAHYVTADLDEGPIIEQDFRRVDHRMSPGQLARTGQELEAMAFARALRWHVERRVVLRGRRTIVFD